MLYLKDANLAFIHVPKNGGKSVHRALEQAGTLSFAAFARDLGIDEDRAGEIMGEDIEGMDGLGMIKPIHLPLAFIRDHFPHSWDVLINARSVILTRAPRDRFLSALLQRLRELRGFAAIRADDPAVLAEARAVCAWLDGRPVFCDLEYIHFARQVDYADLDGVRMIDAVFPIDRTDAFSLWVREQTGLLLKVEHDHARREPRRWAGPLQPAARFIGRKLMPLAIKRAIYPLWMNSGAFANAADRYDTLDLGPEVENFIAAYYAPDARLHEEACANADAVCRKAVA